MKSDAKLVSISDGKFPAEAHDSQDDSLLPTPHVKIDLRDAHAIRREFAALYRDMRAGRLDPHDGCKLAYVLNLLRQSYEAAVLEERLELLERSMAPRKLAK